MYVTYKRHKNINKKERKAFMDYNDCLMRYLQQMSKQYKNIKEVTEEIINLQAILNLPKGTEVFLSDIHGEYGSFSHILNNGSGIIRSKIEDLFSNTISEKERRITAYHEAGRAILFHVLPDLGPVYSVSIIPTGSAGGYTMPLPEKDEMFNTKGKMLQDITVSLGGRVAEEKVFDDITTGASQDIKQATAVAKAMVTQYGMSEKVGLINYDDDSDNVFIGRDLAHARGYGEGVATVIDQEVKRIIDECYQRAKDIIQEYDHVLHACADLLLAKEKITREEFEALFEVREETAEVKTEEN